MSWTFVMVALCNRADHYIFALWFLSFYRLSIFFIPRLILAATGWMSTILWHMVWPWCEFRMQVWNVLHAARCKYRTQQWCKNRHLCTSAQLCRAISSQLRHVSTIGKNLLSSNISHTCPYNMVNFGLLAAEIISLVWAPQQISTAFMSWQCYCTVLQQLASAKLCGS